MMRMIFGALVMLLSTWSVPVYAAPGEGKTIYNSSVTPIGTLLDDPASRLVLDKYMPGFSGNVRVKFIRGRTLKQIQPLSDGGITDATLAKIDAGLAKIGAR